MNSFNHYAIGAVAEWMYRVILGINNDDAHPGYEQFVIHPMPGGGLTWAKGSYRSIRGTIESSWRVEQGAFTLDVTIPANTTATVYVPAKSVESVTESGVPASRAAGVHFVQMDDGAAVFHVSRGSTGLLRAERGSQGPFEAQADRDSVEQAPVWRPGDGRQAISSPCRSPASPSAGDPTRDSGTATCRGCPAPCRRRDMPMGSSAPTSVRMWLDVTTLPCQCGAWNSKLVDPIRYQRTRSPTFIVRPGVWPYEKPLIVSLNQASASGSATISPDPPTPRSSRLWDRSCRSSRCLRRTSSGFRRPR